MLLDLKSVNYDNIHEDIIRSLKPVSELLRKADAITFMIKDKKIEIH